MEEFFLYIAISRLSGAIFHTSHAMTYLYKPDYIDVLFHRSSIIVEEAVVVYTPLLPLLLRIRTRTLSVTHSASIYLSRMPS